MTGATKHGDNAGGESDEAFDRAQNAFAKMYDEWKRESHSGTFSVEGMMRDGEMMSHRRIQNAIHK